MPYDAQDAVFSTIEQFYEAERPSNCQPCRRIVHCINPFLTEPGSEHERALRVTLASMARAREVARLLCPGIEIVFAKVTLDEDVESSLLEFDLHQTLDRSVQDLGKFRIPRPLPLVMDILTAIPVQSQDVFVFTNIDIALSSNFYVFIQSLFENGADCAIINRRTISGLYCDENDLALMECETGAPHPGFDCFAMRGHLRDRLFPYNSCVGVGGVMLPLVHQLLAFADRPVVLLDAHATFHLGDDRAWTSDDFADYAEYNRKETDRVFALLIEDATWKERLVRRLAGAHQPWVFRDNLRELAGVEANIPSKVRSGVFKQLRSTARYFFEK